VPFGLPVILPTKIDMPRKKLFFMAMKVNWVMCGIGLSRWTITQVGVPPSDTQVLPEQQARDKSKAKRKNL
jgi:hypothetical protein